MIAKSQFVFVQKFLILESTAKMRGMEHHQEDMDYL